MISTRPSSFSWTGAARICRSMWLFRLARIVRWSNNMMPAEDRVHPITLSMAQLRDVAAALNLPEGIYRLRPQK